MYYIYHILGVKIGCTSVLQHRMQEQGFTEWEVLETHEDIYVASDREIELQKQYGYRVDDVPYYISVQNRPKWNNQTRHVFTNQERSDAGKLGGAISGANNGKVNRVLTEQDAEDIRNKFIPRKYSANKLAKEYSVSRATIQRIIYNKTYN